MLVGLVALGMAFAFWTAAAMGSALAQLGLVAPWAGAWLGCAWLLACLLLCSWRERRALW